MKRLKKIRLLCLFILLPFMFTGCSNNNPSDNNSEENSDVANVLKVSFIDVGKGDSILIESNNKFMLIDAGDPEISGVVFNYLKQQGVKKLDYIIGTHPHSDHLGGLEVIFNSYKCIRLITPDVPDRVKTYPDYYNISDILLNRCIQKYSAKVGTEYQLGKAKFTIIAPNSTDYDAINNFSVVIKLVYGTTSFIFTGDALKLSESEMIKLGYNLTADVLKVGHHGASDSTSDEFLDAVNPKSAVISTASYYDTAETVTKILNRNINLYMTDDMGTIVATSDGKTVTFDKTPITKGMHIPSGPDPVEP